MQKGRIVLLAVAALVVVGSLLAWSRLGDARSGDAAAAAPSTPELEARKQEILAREDDASPEARRRRSHSEAILKAEGVPVAKALPVIWTESNSRLRDQRDIAFRALALLAVSLKATGAEQSNVENFIGNYELDEHFTPAEMAFLQNPSPSDAELAQFSWRYEAAWPMLWALGFVDKLDQPSAPLDPDAILALLKDRDLDQLMAQARLRPLAEILDQGDLIYRYHWAVVDARVNSQPKPPGLDADVVPERHQAFNWMLGYLNQAWDDVTTDT